MAASTSDLQAEAMDAVLGQQDLLQQILSCTSLPLCRTAPQAALYCALFLATNALACAAAARRGGGAGA